MPDYTVSSDIDDLLRTANDAAARTGLGLGTADSSNNSIKIEVPGAASTNINWVCTIQTTEVTI